MNSLKENETLKKVVQIILYLLAFNVVLMTMIVVLSSVKIPVNQAIIKQILKRKIPNQLVFQIKNCEIQFPYLIKIDELKISDNKNIDCTLYDTEFQFDFINYLLNRKNYFMTMSYSSMKTFFLKTSNSFISSQKGSMKKTRNGDFFLDLKIKGGNHTINFCGIINSDFPKSTQDIWQYLKNRSFEKTYKLDIDKFLLNKEATKIDALLVADSVLSLSFAQRNNRGANSSVLSNLEGFVILRDTNGKLNLLSNLSFDELVVSQSSQKFKIKNACIFFNGNLSSGVSGISDAEASFSFKNLDLLGSVQGKVPSFIFRHMQTNSAQISHIFSNSSDFFTSITTQNDYQSSSKTTGTLKFFPNRLNFSVEKNDKSFKVFSGEKIELSLYENTNPRKRHYPISFRIEGKEVSILEAPTGNFVVNGEISNEYDLEIHDSYANIGSSDVKFSYTHLFKTLCYKLTISGFCNPKNVDNWMPPWWEKLWLDFKFHEIPRGNFVIDGIWGGPVGNTRSFGFVETRSLEFRELPVKSSRNYITVDSDSISVIGKEVIHKHGKFDGSLTFPRKYIGSPVFLNFEIEGDFPFDDGKRVFGKSVYKFLSDSKVTKIKCKGDGKIVRSDVESNSSHEYKIALNSSTGGNFKGIPFESIRGEIFHINNKTEGKFNSVSLAGGNAKFYFASYESLDSTILSIDLDLKEANSTRIVEIVSGLNESKLSNVSFKSKLNKNSRESIKDGKLNLMIQAKGPPSDFLQFVGTGRILLKQKGLSQINLLGGISRELSKLSVFPSGAFTFNKLDALFKINHGKLIFDEFRLTGPISSIDALGNLNLQDGSLDLNSKVRFAGNFPIPGIKELVNLADPISKILELKIYGTIEEPNWDIMVNSLP